MLTVWGSSGTSAPGSGGSTVTGSSTEDNISTLKKTGQANSFDIRSRKVSNCAIRDDGCYQKGVSPSYTRNDADQIVTDNITHLIWQDDADARSLKKKRLTNEQHVKCHRALRYDENASECYQTEGDTATTYCENLNLGGHSDWRLPTVRELRSIIVYGTRGPAMDETVFHNISKNPYWSSNVFTGDRFYAEYINSWRGNISGDFQSREYYVRCARGNKLPAISLTRDSNSDVVKDNVRHLMWQDDITTTSGEKTWMQAIDYCEDLALGGFDDWRLPNIRELKSIINLNKITPSIYEDFVNCGPSEYWSSTSYFHYEYHAWTADFSNAGDYTRSKKKSYLVRCVRDDK